MPSIRDGVKSCWERCRAISSANQSSLSDPGAENSAPCPVSCQFAAMPRNPSPLVRTADRRTPCTYTKSRDAYFIYLMRLCVKLFLRLACPPPANHLKCFESRYSSSLCALLPIHYADRIGQAVANASLLVPAAPSVRARQHHFPLTITDRSDCAYVSLHHF